MKANVPETIDFIQQLELNEADKTELLGKIKALEKDILRVEFKIGRTLKDKSIAINLLNATIEDLQKHQHYVEETNEKLFRQKEEIERKNIELERQKQLVEKQAKMLENHLKDLEHSYNELEQFSYIASHDLKSPLRTIASYAQLLKRRYHSQLDEDADEFINFIVKGANHMNDIIRDLLEYSRSGREQEFTNTNLNNTLEVVKFNLQDEIQKSNTKIIAHGLPTSLVVNKSSLIQLFQNLIGNAIKFQREGVPPHIIIESFKNGTHWHFRVSDNGVGMDENFQKKAFLPFQRINNLERPGTGMGLAICKKVVKMHKGEIWYIANKDSGTTFNFTLSQNVLS
jgi:light-regulated signal transduction histidine kinase (bacteriophytochrome)